MKKKIFLSFIIVFLGIMLWQLRPSAQSLMPIGGGSNPIPKELVIGKTYGTNVTFKASLDDSHAFTLSKTEDVGSERKIVVDGIGLADDFEVFATHRYIAFKLDNIVNAPYQSEVIGYLNQGDIVEITHSRIEEKTYELSLATTLKRCLASSVNALFKFDLLNIGGSSTEAIESALTLGIKSETSISDISSLTITYSIPDAGTYYAQRRANYELYLIASFEIIYDCRTETKQVGLYNNTYYTYSVSGYKLLETKLWYKLVKDCGMVISRYEYDNNGQAVYAGPILNNTYLYL